MNTRTRTKVQVTNKQIVKQSKSKEKIKSKSKPKRKEETPIVRTKNGSFRDQKINESFINSNLNRKTIVPSKSRVKATEVTSKSLKRTREERSSSKNKITNRKREREEESEEEELPKSVKNKKVKVVSKQKLKEDDDEEEIEEEIIYEKVEVSSKIKRNKRDNNIMMVDEEEESVEEIVNKSKRSRSTPQKSKKATAKQEESEDEQISEEDEDEDYNKSTKAKTKTKVSTKKTTKSKSKSNKLPTVYKKGKFNPNIEILSSCKYMESKEPIIYDECCVHCNNRNSFRAANTRNLNLLKKCINSHQEISTICDVWAKDYPYSALDLAIQHDDRPMITEILKVLTNSDNSKIIRITKPQHKLSIIETGENNQMAYGVRTRQLNMTRGNREGNNAFLEEQEFNFVVNVVKTVFKYAKDGKIIDFIQASLTNPFTQVNPNRGIMFNHLNIDFNEHLPIAIREGNKAVAHHLLNKINNSKTLQNYGYNQLHFLVLDSKDGEFDVSHKSSLNKKSIGKAIITPVHVACINPNEKILKKLIDLGADWHFMDDLNRKPIHYAAVCEGPGPLKLLLESGAHVDEPDKMKVTPLILAAKCGRFENVKLLIKSKANLQAKDKTGNMALHEAALNGHSEIIRILVEEGGMKVDQTGQNRMIPLMMATLNGHKNCVETLLELNAKVTKKDKFKRTPLLLSCKSGQSVITSILLRAGSDFDQADSSQNSPLHYACAYGWSTIVDLLLKAGADVNKTNMWKISPLEVAMLKNHFGIVKFLLNNSEVNVNMKFDKGNTLLHHSFRGITNKSISEIGYLINDKKADTNIQNLEGKSTLHLLAEFDFQSYKIYNPVMYNNLMNYNRHAFNQNYSNEIMLDEELINEELKSKDAHRLMIKNLFEILMNSKAEVDLKTAQGKTPLQIALEKKNIPFIEEIMNFSPDLLFVDSTGQTILHLLNEYVFNEEGEDIMKRILNKLVNLENVKDIVNIVDNLGFTPILRLFYKYSIEVKGFYDRIITKESYKIKSNIYEESLKKVENNNRNNINLSNINEDFDDSMEPNRIRSNQYRNNSSSECSDDYDDEEELDFMPKKKVMNYKKYKPKLKPENKLSVNFSIPSQPMMALPISSFPAKKTPSFGKGGVKRPNFDYSTLNGATNFPLLSIKSTEFLPQQGNWTSLNAVGVKYAISQDPNLSKHQKIVSINLLPEDINVVTEKARGLLFEYINFTFDNIVFSYIKLGCDVHSQVQKLKKWRDRKPGEEVKEDLIMENDDQHNFNGNVRRSRRTPFGFGQFNPFNNATTNNTGLMTMARKKVLRPSKYNINHTVIKSKQHTEMDEYLTNYGGVNIIMLMMAFPSIQLLEHFIDIVKVDVNILDICNKNVLFHLINNYSNLNQILPEAFDTTLNILIKNKINLDQLDKDKNSAFLLLGMQWAIAEMKKLSNNGADVNQTNNKGENALIHSIRAKDKFKVNYLLNTFNFDVNHKDDKLRTAVHYLYNDEDSSADIDVSFKKILLSRNPDVNARDISGRTPLHYLFVKIGKEFDNSAIDPIVSLSTLLDLKGIQIDVQDNYGNTPLHYASQRGATICAMALIQKSDLNQKNFEGNSALGYSIMFDHPNFSIVLVQEKANFFESAFPLKDRDEKVLLKNMKKNKLNVSVEIGNISSQNIATNSQVSTVVIKKKQKDMEDEILQDEEVSDDSSQSSDDDDNNNFNNYNKGLGGAFGGKFGFPQPTGFNYNPYQQEVPQLTSAKTLNDKYYLTNEDKEKGISLFRLCVKNNYQGLTYLLVNNSYDLMRAIQDSFYENKFNLAMLLLDKSPYDEVYRKVNEKGQNLFHILAVFGDKVLNKSDLNLFFEKLSEKGISLTETDSNGFTPFHYSCQYHFLELSEYILSKTDAQFINSIITKNGYTPFICAIKGKYSNISKESYINLLINHIDKRQISMNYAEESYGVNYKCTPVIHFTRQYLENSRNVEPILTQEGKCLIKLISHGASVMERDSNGLDCLMYCVKENNLKMLELFVKNCSNEIQFDSVDSEGKSLVHYAVSPMDEGSFENEALLTFLLEKGFAGNSKDKFGKTPSDYAKEQETGINLRILKRYKIATEDLQVLRRQNSIITLNQWPVNIYNFEEDADKLYQMIFQNSNNKREEIILLPDSLGNFASDTHKLYKDSNGYWDVTMTKVKVGAGLYGEYNFYKMQLIHDMGRDIYILWNRFGRIGENGQHQRTPFNSFEEAETEFKKIFKDKSGNEWQNKSSFQRVKGKYMLLHFNEFKLSHKDILESFDLKKCPESLISQKEVRNLLKELTNTTIYFKALSESGIDTEILNFNYLNKGLILKARYILGEINNLKQEIQTVSNTRDEHGQISADTVDKVLELKSKIYEMSSRYYELIPKMEFKNKVVRALEDDHSLKNEIMLLENLTYVENAVKILLGAQLRQKEMNPLDYCLNALNVSIENINKTSNEFSILNKYITVNSDRVNFNKVLNIFKIQRKGEADQMTQWKNIDNHYLLFHGSKVFNFIGILANGLKIAPPEAPVTGYLYGKGVYFADLFDKSIAYCDNYDFEDERGVRKNHKYMLMCEVALGKMFEVSQYNAFDPELSFLSNGYNSLKSTSSKGPDPSQKFVLNNGVTIPLGEEIEFNNNNNMNYASQAEYVVYDSSQIRMRYLVQIENEGY